MDSIVRILAIIVLGIAYISLGNAYRYSGEEAVEQRIPVRTPPMEKRLFQGLELSNKMRVLLISDPSADRATVSLVVGVGGINDMVGMQGLTNLTGGVLLGQSGRYTRFYGFNDFLKDNNGHMDLPAVKTQDQVFEFNLDARRLAPALRRFGDMFVRPVTLSRKVPTRIILKALTFVQLEFQHRSRLDKFRTPQVEKAICRPNHPYCTLLCGNKETLLQNVPPNNLFMATLYQRVKNYQQRRYSSNIMTLAVLGNETLDELEAMVVPQFKDVINRNISKIEVQFAMHPWGPDQLGYKIYVLATENTNLLRIKFPIPDRHMSYKTGPETYLCDLLANKEQNSLYSLLRKTNLCTDLKVKFTFNAGVTFFKIMCSFTAMVSQEHIDDIINHIFQYIHLIRNEGVQEWMFYNSKHIRQQRFLDHPVDVEVSELALLMQYYPTEEILSFNFIADEWDQELIEEILSYLRPNNMNVTIVSRHDWGPITTRYEMERHFGTFYKKERIPEHIIKKWDQMEQIPQLQLPLHNEFIPENFNLSPRDRNGLEHKYPRVIYKSSIMEIWHKHDDEFNVAKLHIGLQIYSSSFHLNPCSHILLRIFTTLLQMSLEESLYTAKVVGFDWVFDYGVKEVTIRLNGYQNKLPLLLTKILAQMMNLKSYINEKNFQAAQQQYLKKLENSMTKSGEELLRLRMKNILVYTWSAESLFSVGNSLTYQDMKKFLSKMFKRVFIQGFIHGNCNVQEARSIIGMVKGHFHLSNGLLLQEYLQSRAIEFAPGHSIYKEINQSIEKSAYLALYSINNNPSDLRKQVASYLLETIISPSCQKLFSNVPQTTPAEINCFLIKSYNSLIFAVKVVSEKEPNYIDRGVELMFHDAVDELKDVKSQRFKLVKKYVKKQRMMSSNLMEVFNHYFREIVTRFYDFERIEKQTSLLNSMETEQLVDFFKEVLDRNSPRRRKLAIHIYPTALNQAKHFKKKAPRHSYYLSYHALSSEDEHHLAIIDIHPSSSQLIGYDTTHHHHHQHHH